MASVSEERVKAGGGSAYYASLGLAGREDPSGLGALLGGTPHVA